MNRYAFADRVVVTDLRARQAAFPFQILRLKPNAGEGVNLVALAQPRVAVNHDVRKQAAARPQLDVLPDNAVGSDFAAVADSCLGMDGCRRMNHNAFVY